MSSQKLQVALYQRYGTIDLVNIFHFESIGAEYAFPADVNTLGEDLRLNLTTHIANLQASALVHRRLVIGEYTATGMVDYEYLYPQPMPGGRGNRDLSDPKTAMILTWYSAVGGKRGRGRSYLCDVGYGSGDVGRWSDEGIAAATAEIGNILAVYGTGGTDLRKRLSVFSRVTNANAKPPTDASFEQIIRGKVQVLFGTQRKRRPTTWV